MSTLNQQGNFIIQFAMGDSTGIDEVFDVKLVSTVSFPVAAINFYNEYFTHSDEYRAPPEDFDPNLINVFLGVLSDLSSELRVRASYILVKLAECPKLAHTIADTGALRVLVGFVLYPDYPIRCNCLCVLIDVALHCHDCNKAIRATNVMEGIETLMRSEPIQPVRILENTISCFFAILKCKQENQLLMTTVIPLIVIIMTSHESESVLTENSLSALALLANDTIFTDSEIRSAHIQAMLSEEELISSVVRAISSGNPILSRYALLFIESLLRGGTNAQREPILMLDGFVKKIAECLDSSWSHVRYNAAYVLIQAADGPRHHIQLILKEVEVIVQLMSLLYHDDKKLQELMCWIFARLFGSSANKPELTMEEFVRNGVRTINEYATKIGADATIVSMIREVLPKQLLTHSEFSRIAEGSSRVSRNAKFHFKKEKGFLSSLASFANFSCFRAVTQAHTVHDSSRDATPTELPKKASG